MVPPKLCALKLKKVGTISIIKVIESLKTKYILSNFRRFSGFWLKKKEWVEKIFKMTWSAKMISGKILIFFAEKKLFKISDTKIFIFFFALN